MPGADRAEGALALAEAVRMLAAAEVLDYNGHCSVRTGPDTFLVNSGRSVRSALTVADVVEVDGDGRAVGPGDAPPLEFHLHAQVYRRRPDIGAVVHGHPRWSTYLTIAGTPLLPVYAQGALLGRVPTFDNPLSVNDPSMGAAVAETLGDGRAVLLRSHGSLVVGADIVEAFALALYLEDNAQRQYHALQVGAPYAFSAAEQDACRRNLWKPHLFRKAWDNSRARLDADTPPTPR